MTQPYKRFLFLPLLMLSFSLSNASAYAVIDLSPKTAVNTSLDTEVETNNGNISGSVNINADTKVEDDEDNEDQDDNSTVINANQVIKINRSEIKGDDRSESGEEHRAVIMGHGDVRTFGDLRAFAKSTIEGDENVDELNFNSKKAEMSYRQEGRFLALLPVPMKVKITVYANGDVVVKYPWYSFLTVDNQDEIEAKIKVAVDNVMRGRLVGSVQAEGKSANPTLTPSQIADVVSRIREVLQSTFGGTEATSTTSASSSAGVSR